MNSRSTGQGPLRAWSGARRHTVAVCLAAVVVLGLCSSAQAATGTVRDDRLVDTVGAKTVGAQATVSAGPRKVAVLLFTFPGQPAEPWSANVIRSEVFTAPNSANAFYQEESYGGISLTGKLSADGDVFGWFRIAASPAGCPYNEWAREANEAANDAGIELAGYQHLIYMFPQQNSCSWSGIAGVSNAGAMINGNAGVGVITHELGHTFGLFHAGSWTCTSGGIRVQISDTCTISEYGDPFDVMGQTTTPRHNSGWNLAKLGILGPENVETVDASGTYSMHSALHPTTEPVVLRIPREKEVDGSVTSWYYLEIREKGGVFENVADASTTGVSIRVAPSNFSAETLLLDANPATPTFQDAPLGVGQTFDGGPVRIKTLAAGGGAATVSVELDEESTTAPAGLIATGGVERGQLQWTASTDDFGVERYVVFRDGSEIGTSKSTSFLDSPATVGDHEYVVYAEDASGNRSPASNAATATVTPDEEPPTAPADLTAVAGVEGVQLRWTASSDNFGVDHYLVFRDGSEIEGAEGTSFLDPLASSGTREYVVYAEDAVGNRSAASAPATVMVPVVSGPGCTAGSCRVTFRYAGAASSWQVPPGVGKADFTVEGAQGGGRRPSGWGARVKSSLGSLTAGEEAILSVGGAGELAADGRAGGFNGGGDGTRGGGGGGFTSVRLGGTLELLAAGGGGEGLKGFNAISEEEPAGGRGGSGGQAGTVGFPGIATQAYGATLGKGSGGVSAGSGAAGGAAGDVTGASACPGGAQAGATGASGGSFAGGGGQPGAGGGGGGGYVGGGQGGGGAVDACGSSAGSGGGGGGSSFAADGLAATFSGNVRRAGGQVSIEYPNPIAAGGRGYTTLPDQELAVPAASGVLASASGPAGDPLSASVATPPAHGSVVLEADGSFTYAPDPGYRGSDSFVYRVADFAGDYATAQVSLTVASPPAAAVSLPAAGGTYEVGQSVLTAFSCGEGAGGSGLASCTDSNGLKTGSGGFGHLDTAAAGSHEYTVTALSKDGLRESTSIGYAVVPASRLPGSPGAPPRDPAEPGPRVDLSLAAERESLSKLFRTGELFVTATVTEPAKVKLTGSTELATPTRRAGRTKSVATFVGKTVSFARPGERRVKLVLSGRERAALRGLSKLKLTITGRATDAAGATATKTVALTLRP
jgi:hypothetical protein